MHRVTWGKKRMTETHRIKYVTGNTNHEAKEIFGGTSQNLFYFILLCENVY